MNNFQRIYFNCKEIIDQIILHLSDPRKEANQVLKLLDREIKECEDSHIEIHSQLEVSLINMEEQYKEEKVWIEKVKKSLSAGNETSAQVAASEAIKRRKIADRYQQQVEKIVNVKNALLEEIISRREEKENLRMEIELLNVEYSVAKSRNKIARILNGVGTDVNIYDRIKNLKEQVKQINAQSTARIRASQEIYSNSIESQGKIIDTQIYKQAEQALIEEARKELKLIKS
jgi:phage shock protein A